MPRPKKCRIIEELPLVRVFKPAGKPVSDVEATSLSYDELEAVRLADLKRYSHADAAGKMGVSRATFGRIVESARAKITASIIEGRALIIDGGDWCHPAKKNGRTMKKCTVCKRFNQK
jgi:predicted DNA-binding protein (UPF0251 family)